MTIFLLLIVIVVCLAIFRATGKPSDDLATVIGLGFAIGLSFVIYRTHSFFWLVPGIPLALFLTCAVLRGLGAWRKPKPWNGEGE